MLKKKNVNAINGAIGGKKKNPRKGFGSATPEQRAEWGRKGAKSRWGKSKKVVDKA